MARAAGLNPAAESGLLLLDGGLGQELVRRAEGPSSPIWSAQALLDAPDLVGRVHDEFFAAGAAVATTNTYVLSRQRLGPHGLADRLGELTEVACRQAVASRDRHGHGLVVGSLGPLGPSYRHDLALDPDEATVAYAELARLQAPYVDVLLCETMASVDEARGAVAGASAAGLPVWLAMTVDDHDGRRLRSGEAVDDVVSLAITEGVDVVLVNCSRPEAVDAAVACLAPRLTGGGPRLGAYANGFVEVAPLLATPGTVDVLDSRDDLTPERYAGHVARWRGLGADVVGGCCEVGPDHIAAIAARCQG